MTGADNQQERPQNKEKSDEEIFVCGRVFGKTPITVTRVKK
jgi:hypothetical protein